MGFPLENLNLLYFEYIIENLNLSVTDVYMSLSSLFQDSSELVLFTLGHMSVLNYSQRHL